MTGEIREGGTLLGPITPGGSKHKWFVEFVGKPRGKTRTVRVRMMALLPGVRGTLMKSTVTAHFPEGKATGEWSVVGE